VKRWPSLPFAMGIALAKSVVFLPPPSSDVDANGKRKKVSTYLVWDERTKGTPGGGVKRPFLWIPAAQNSKRTIIFFHGNAEDLDIIESDMVTVGAAFRCNLLAVEYPGYGLCGKAGQEASFEGIDDVAIHALLYCVMIRGIPASQVVLYGRSLGSGPALRVAKRAREQLNYSLGGIVLQCPFISIKQVASDYVFAGGLLMPAECYDNLGILRDICGKPNNPKVERWVPILILHGELDTVIYPYHGKTLLSEAKQLGHPMVEAFFSPTATHNNWLLGEDVVKPVMAFLAKYVEGWSKEDFQEEQSWATRLVETLFMDTRCTAPF